MMLRLNTAIFVGILGGRYESVASCLFPSSIHGRELLLERSERAQKRCLSEFECGTRTVPDYDICVGLTLFPKRCLFVVSRFWMVLELPVKQKTVIKRNCYIDIACVYSFKELPVGIPRYSI